jgi:hypothetical protein
VVSLIVVYFRKRKDMNTSKLFCEKLFETDGLVLPLELITHLEVKLTQYETQRISFLQRYSL